MRTETKDQVFYRVGKRLKAVIDVDATHERADAPSLAQCRHAVLPLNNKDKGYVVYDRVLCRIVNGVFRNLEMALGVAQSYNERPDAPQDMNPNGLALGLIYPEVKREEQAS